MIVPQFKIHLKRRRIGLELLSAEADIRKSAGLMTPHKGHCPNSIATNNLRKEEEAAVPVNAHVAKDENRTAHVLSLEEIL